MESFFALLQKNVLNRNRWQTRDELRLAILIGSSIRRLATWRRWGRPHTARTFVGAPSAGLNEEYVAGNVVFTALTCLFLAAFVFQAAVVDPNVFIPARLLVGLGAICFTLYFIVSALESGTTSSG